MPFAQLCNDNFRDPRERILMKNIAYAGTLVAALHVDMEIVAALLEEKYAGKKKLQRIESQALCGWATITPAIISIARCRSIWKRWTPTATRS